MPCERRGHHFEVSGKCRDCQHGAYDILTTDERIEHAREVAARLEAVVDVLLPIYEYWWNEVMSGGPSERFGPLQGADMGAMDGLCDLAAVVLGNRPPLYEHLDDGIDS